MFIFIWLASLLLSLFCVLHWVVFPFRIKYLKYIVFFLCCCFFFLLDLDILFVIFIVFSLIIRKHSAMYGSVPQVKGMKNGMENQIMSYSQHSWENILCSQILWEFVSIFFSLPESIQLFSFFIFFTYSPKK